MQEKYMMTLDTFGYDLLERFILFPIVLTRY